MTVNSPVPPTIKVKPAEWHWATWRKYTPQPREVLPFDSQPAIAPSAADILTQLDKLNAWRCPRELVIPLANLLPVIEVIQVSNG